jgi:hypothetical protein
MIETFLTTDDHKLGDLDDVVISDLCQTERDENCPPRARTHMHPSSCFVPVKYQSSTGRSNCCLLSPLFRTSRDHVDKRGYPKGSRWSHENFEIL